MLEIERKFLLKRLPIEPPSEVLLIKQWYMDVNGVMVRVRKVEFNDGSFDFIKTIKTPIDEMTYEENESQMLPKDFYDFVDECLVSDNSYYIAKKRHIYVNDNDKWEVDQYLDFDLVVAELEIPHKEYSFEIPEHIKDELIMEVTGKREFSNFSLSEKLND